MTLRKVRFIIGHVICCASSAAQLSCTLSAIDICMQHCNSNHLQLCLAGSCCPAKCGLICSTPVSANILHPCAGGLMFGWNALALALKGQDIYATGCAAEREGMPLNWAMLSSCRSQHKDCGANKRAACTVLRNAGGSDTLCPTQESKLAVLWTIGIFALNFGPVFVGPILDWVGPKLTTVLGELAQPCVQHFGKSRVKTLPCRLQP